MKILFYESQCHRKNSIGFDLLCNENNIDSLTTTDQSYFSSPYDLVIIPSGFVPYSLFPNTKYIMYGPHNFVFANGIWQGPTQKFPEHCFYNLLSDWIVEVQNEFGGLSLVPKAIPFPVDTTTFCPQDSYEKKYDCFIYFKGRKQELLPWAESRLKSMGLRYVVLRYGSYTEDEYLHVLRSSKFGIWIGSHESQGFALQEALSTNTPLAVWNVKSMFDEHNRENKICYNEDQRLYKLKATSVPYWEARCGELFYEKEEFDTTVQKVLANYSDYSPRAYIEETLSAKACYKRLLTVLEEIPGFLNSLETPS